MQETQKAIVFTIIKSEEEVERTYYLREDDEFILSTNINNELNSLLTISNDKNLGLFEFINLLIKNKDISSLNDIKKIEFYDPVRFNFIINNTDIQSIDCSYTGIASIFRIVLFNGLDLGNSLIISTED